MALVWIQFEVGVVNLHGHDGEGLEEKGERRLAARQTTVEETDTRDDEPDEEGAHHQIDVVELEAGILGVDVHVQGVATVGHGVVKHGLRKKS